MLMLLLNFTAQAARSESEPYPVKLPLEEHWEIP